MTLPELTDEEFALFQALIYREAGIHLGPAKRALLVGRLGRRLRHLGLRSFWEYYRRVVDGAADERTAMLDCICTNETHFFRQPEHFALLEREVFPRLAARPGRRIRAWSAGCSTGEEPYTLAMALLDAFPPEAGFAVEILATDLSTTALAAAEAGVWPLAKAAEIPRPCLTRYMLKGKDGQAGKMKAGREIRALVRFERVNLNDDPLPVAGPFELIFCRNVLIYFDAASRARAIHGLIDRLSDDGLLFLGQAESLNGVTQRARCVVPTVYARRGAS